MCMYMFLPKPVGDPCPCRVVAFVPYGMHFPPPCKLSCLPRSLPWVWEIKILHVCDTSFSVLESRWESRKHLGEMLLLPRRSEIDGYKWYWLIPIDFFFPRVFYSVESEEDMSWQGWWLSVFIRTRANSNINVSWAFPVSGNLHERAAPMHGNNAAFCFVCL